MIKLPRLALAIPSVGPEPSPAGLALLAGLTERRTRVQHFRSRGCPYGTPAVEQITGRPGRHLDDWLMTPDLCRTVFVRGMCRADLAVVEGTLEPMRAPAGHAHYDQPGALGQIALALDLPRIALVPCPRLEGLHLPTLPEGTDAVLLDGLEEAGSYEAVRRVVALMLNKPVIGAVEAMPGIRAAVRDAGRESDVPKEIFDALGASFLRFADLHALRTLAESRDFPVPHDEPCQPPQRRFRVAYAQDEAFGAYFPDTLETLEALGAELCEFSPLRDESLPEAVDLVMIGCGHPDRHADALAQNHSLIAALRAHVCDGNRIYSEGGGTAYLGRYLILDGKPVPGAGILPFDAELRSNPMPPKPVSRLLTRDSWLGPRGTIVRGYRSGRWRLHPAPEPGDCPGRSGPLSSQRDIYCRHHAIGSLIHLHLVALPQVVSAFAGPHRPSLSLS
ncbi:MAG TPA: cobyrinic acid a,c-diamide synthase [Isosphaeraceae bacterium]|jgi:cobyrinic acid a,c-diamide synthase|nr:cobyrinic acid a,c-diamide synthase [Isosphaeraceae bacterium]